MTDVKRMSAKEDFLKMSLKDRNCEVELYEECKTRKLMEGCNCVPWELPDSQVRCQSSPQYFFFREWTCVTLEEETALRGTLPSHSTAAQLVLGSMLMSNGTNGINGFGIRIFNRRQPCPSWTRISTRSSSCNIRNSK